LGDRRPRLRLRRRLPPLLRLRLPLGHRLRSGQGLRRSLPLLRLWLGPCCRTGLGLRPWFRRLYALRRPLRHDAGFRRSGLWRSLLRPVLHCTLLLLHLPGGRRRRLRGSRDTHRSGALAGRRRSARLSRRRGGLLVGLPRRTITLAAVRR
jgi:hypothetical protein